MKTVGLITVHKSLSYGACLQAYATWAAIRDLGYDVEFIDFGSHKEQRTQSVISRRKEFGFAKNISETAKNILLRRQYHQKKGFAAFHASMRVSACSYSHVSEMKNVGYDILVSGSDQLWNPKIFDIEPAYFLDFSDAAKKIAYGASIGSYVYSSAEKETVAQLLCNYTHISVREQFAKEQIQPLSSVPVEVVVDPTLLYGRGFWLSETDNHGCSEQPYILLYLAEMTLDYYKDIVESVSRALKLPVYYIVSHNHVHAGITKNLVELPVNAFPRVVGNAALVLTNSFHGVAFSINLGRDFIALENPNNTRRTEQLLDDLGLTHRLAKPGRQLSGEYLEPIAYQTVESRLGELRDQSWGWLRNALEG